MFSEAGVWVAVEYESLAVLLNESQGIVLILLLQRLFDVQGEVTNCKIGW